MLTKLERKILEIKTIKINGFVIEIKRVTPEDFIGKEGIPISRWQTEAEILSNRQKESQITLPEMQKLWRKIFSKAIVSVGYNYNTPELKDLIDKIVGNYYLSNIVYSEIIDHCLGVKKNKTIKSFQKILV